MRKLFILLMTCNILFSQTYNDDFLDGTIIFKMKNFVEVNYESSTKSDDNIGLEIDIRDYPKIFEIF